MPTAADAVTPLDQQLCFALHATSRAVVGLYREGLDALGLTYTQYLVLLLLWEHEQMTVRELGQRLEMDSGTLSPVTKRLEARGMVTRHRDPDDERSVIIAITDEARSLEGEVRQVQCRVAAATGMDDEVLGAIRDQLHDLSARIAAGQA